MVLHTLIVIGSSAGDVEALITLVSALPKNFSAPICIAQHLSPLLPSSLPAILSYRGRLPASHPPSGARLVGGAIFLAPPVHNLSITGEHVVVTQAPLQWPCPSINLLFESAARSYRSGLIGVILTSMLSDGSAGLQAVKHYGGKTIIQDLQGATSPSMPYTAQDHYPIDYCLPLAHIASLLQELTGVL